MWPIRANGHALGRWAFAAPSTRGQTAHCSQPSGRTSPSLGHRHTKPGAARFAGEGSQDSRHVASETVAEEGEGPQQGPERAHPRFWGTRAAPCQGRAGTGPGAAAPALVFFHSWKMNVPPRRPEELEAGGGHRPVSSGRQGGLLGPHPSAGQRGGTHRTSPSPHKHLPSAVVPRASSSPPSSENPGSQLCQTHEKRP